MANECLKVWHVAGFGTLAAHDELVGREPDVLDADSSAFADAEAGAVQQHGHDARHAVEPIQDRADLVAGQHDGKMGTPLGANEVVEPGEILTEDLSVEKQQGALMVIDSLLGAVGARR